jgi:hypothetical protein
VPAFSRAAEVLRAHGWEVFSPVEKMSEDQLTRAMVAGSDWVGTGDYRKLLADDIVWIAGADAIALLPGYRDSRGAMAELSFAEAAGLEVIFLDLEDPGVVADHRTEAGNPTSRVLEDVVRERERQQGLWGTQRHHPGQWLGLLGEEHGEVCREVNGKNFGEEAAGTAGEHLRAELVQVAAVAVAWVECIDTEHAECVAPEPDEPPLCSRVLVGQGNDTYDPTCSLPAGHEPPCAHEDPR